jgi:predicted nucleic acid-binding protein
MPSIVISDTSCLIIFEKIGQLDLLQKVYDNIVTTQDVAEEYLDILPAWIKIEIVKDKKYQEFLETQIDRGEASAIALAKELNNPLLLLDDLKARKLAGKLNLKFTGTLGVINRAKELGIIYEVKPLLDRLLLTDFRISENVINELLTLNNENAIS